MRSSIPGCEGGAAACPGAGRRTVGGRSWGDRWGLAVCVRVICLWVVCALLAGRSALSRRSPCKNLCDIAPPTSYLHTSRGTVRDLGRCAVGGGARGRRTCRGLVMCASPGVVSSGAFVCMYEARQPSTFGVSAHTTCASGTYVRESTRVSQATRLRSALDARARTLSLSSTLPLLQRA